MKSSNKKRKYKAEDSDSSEEKKDKKEKETSTKIKVTKRSFDSDDDDFDTHVFMLRDDDDIDIMNDQLTNDGMIDPYKSPPSSPASTYDWKLKPSIDLNAYFPYAHFRPPSPSTVISDENVNWRIEYDRAIKKHRAKNPEIGFYININNI